MYDNERPTTDTDGKVVSIKEKFKLITGKAVSVAKGSDPVFHLDDRTLMKTFIQSGLYTALFGLYPDKKWISWERTGTGFNITLFDKEE